MAHSSFGGKYLKRVYSGMNRSSKSILYIVTGALLAGLLVTLLALAGTKADAATLDQFDIARQKHFSDLVGTIPGASSVGDLSAVTNRVTEDAQVAWNSLNVSAPASGEIWADLPTATASQHVNKAYERVLSMALAYRTPNSELYGNQALKNDAIAATTWLTNNRYNSTITKDAGWWFYEIGIPMDVNDIVTLLYDELTSAQVNNYMSSVTFFAPKVKNSGANRVWSSYVVSLSAVLTKNTAKISEGAKGVEPALKVVTSGDGFYADGSFVQHNYFAYTGGYGVSMIDILSKMYFFLHGTTWEIKSTLGLSIYDRINDAYAPVTWCGSVSSSVRGREIARDYAEDNLRGIDLQTAVLRLATIAPASKLENTNSWVKTSLECSKNNPNTVETDGTVSDVVRARLLLANPTINETSLGAGAHAYAGMDRFTHMTNSYGFSLGMNSARIAAFESLSSENLKGWYTSDGATFFYVGNGLQYANNYWATTNAYRIPGTTEDTTKRGNSAGASARSVKIFVGSLATPSNAAGVAVMDFKAYTGALTAKKAWFTFDGKVVALGADINSTGMTGNGYDNKPRRIETTVDNRLALTGSETLRIGGTTVANGTTNTKATTWASISGQGESIGYVFPTATTVSAQNETRTGSWSEVGAKYGSTTTQTNRHMTLNISHGANPTNGSYAYIVLPNVSESQTAAYAQNQDVTILSNTAQLMAVHDTPSNTTGVVSYISGTTQTVNDGTAPSFSVKGAGLVSVERKGTNVLVTVSDPTQASTTPICVTLNQPTYGVISQGTGFTVTESGTSASACFNPTGRKGISSTATFVAVDPNPTEPTLLDFVASGQATVSGAVNIGSTLSATVPSLSPAPTTQTYQWLRNGVAISGANAATYTIASVDAGTVLSFTYTASRTGYNDFSTSAVASGAVIVPTPVLTFTTTPKPTISGVAKVGTKLTAIPGTWSPAPTSFNYQWLRNGVAISGAKSSTYTPTLSDYGTKISVKVTASKAGYTSNSQTSIQTAAVRIF